MSVHFSMHTISAVAVIFCLALNCCGAWDSDELQMFDLIDELKVNFYEFLGVDQTASSSEIRSAYRRLSVKLHPDKNVDNPEAADNFRQLAGIYEILKDTEKRKSYDYVLENGMPDWRSSVFYYRKLRKMSNMELGIIFVLISTTIHYAALWGARFEKCWTLEEQLSSHYKRHKARDRKREEIDELIAQALREIPRPQWHDLLPFAIFKWTYYLIMALPLLFRFTKAQVSEKLEEKIQTWKELAEERERKKAKTENQERKRRNKEQKTVGPSPYNAETLDAFLNLGDISSADAEVDKTDEIPHREWSEEDVVELVHAVARFPGGVPNRWERIASQLNRSVPDVTKKAKELGEKKMHAVYQKCQMSYEVPAFETNFNPVCGESSDEAGESDEIQSNPQIKADEVAPNESAQEAEVVVDEPYLSRKKQKQRKQAALKETSEYKPPEDPSDGWTQVEQKQLEVAIRSISKDTSERWDRIADCVPTKTKAEVMQRVKYLSTKVKSKSAH